MFEFDVICVLQGRYIAEVDVGQLDFRLREVDRKARAGSYAKKKEALVEELESFLLSIGSKESVRVVSDTNVRRFLVFKDKKGKTLVHSTDCPFLGKNGAHPCACPKRLAAGTVESLIGQLRDIFRRHGRGEVWDEARMTGNPACATSVKEYLKVVKQEHSEARVTPKQAKPLFLGKLEKVCNYLGREIEFGGLSVGDRFLALRDRAFLCLQFYAGDRAGDLCHLVAQEVRALPEGEGLVIRNTQGKNHDSSNVGMCIIRPCINKVVCPVANLKAYVEGAESMGLALKVGYIFRTMGGKAEVLETPLTFDAIYKRLKLHLVTLGIYDGETPHSIRGGCAVTMKLTGAAKNVGDLQQHMGWRSSGMPVRYSRMRGERGMEVSKRLQRAIDGDAAVAAADVESKFLAMSYESLPSAF